MSVSLSSNAPSVGALRQRRFARFARFNVVYNLGVILWGAFVRATGSGAGCGDHWPSCNGEVVPMAPAVETVIEFTHRLTSGGALILALVLFVWAIRVWPARSPTRRAAGATFAFMVVEALVGAAIVLLQMTADNDTIGRAVVMGFHLVNTLLLLGAMVLTAWFASGHPVPRPSSNRLASWLLGMSTVGMLVLGASGGVTALGDTLFPAESLAEGLAQDLSPTAHILIRLRVFHPVIAVLVGGFTMVGAFVTGLGRKDHGKLLANALVGLIVVQVLLGGLNVILLAPVWMQLIHLFMADLVWITLVLLAATVLTPDRDARPHPVLAEAASATG
ncbi:MAG: cytochrome oxidase assembly protein [Deltaproteobacteria bacterium]|nr:cytochrome oxidase assembly protein [Deltaproteobacteria bacterium]HCH62835.1 cytochrome oxidase assembly protein [Deltaproteobacteria bacterium]